MKYSIDYVGLKKYLESLDGNDFRIYERAESKSTITNPNEKIKKGVSIQDINFFKMDTAKIPFDQVIQIGTPFLCDVLGNDLSIIELSNKKYTLPNSSRSVKAKFIQNVIEDCHKTFGTALNGYWIIPPQFISYS